MSDLAKKREVYARLMELTHKGEVGPEFFFLLGAVDALRHFTDFWVPEMELSFIVAQQAAPVSVEGGWSRCLLHQRPQR